MYKVITNTTSPPPAAYQVPLPPQSEIPPPYIGPHYPTTSAPLICSWKPSCCQWLIQLWLRLWLKQQTLAKWGDLGWEWRVIRLGSIDQLKAGDLDIVVVACGVSGILEWWQGSLIGLGSFLDVHSQFHTMLLLSFLHNIAFRLSLAPLHVVMGAQFDT